MSSYITSPYELEERRLQGILQQCTLELDKAINNVQKQMNVIEQKEREQKQRELQFDQNQHALRTGFLNQNEAAIKEKEDKRKELIRILHNMDIEIQSLSLHYGNGKMISAVSRQHKLQKLVLYDDVNIGELEREIKSHMQLTEKEVFDNSKQNASQKGISWSFSFTNDVKKGISLKEEMAHSTENIMSPIEKFTLRLQQAKEYNGYEKLHELILLEKQFHNQPEYSKSAFALKNMKNLDSLLQRLMRLDKQVRGQALAQEQMKIKYSALCELVGIKPDINKIQNDNIFQWLSKECDRLQYLYQEKQKRSYVAKAVQSVMEKHGILFQDALNNGINFSMEDISLNVEGVGSDYLTMEVVGNYTGDYPTLNERRKSVASAQHFCSLLSTIETELKTEFGIHFKKISREEPNENTIQMKKNIARNSKKYHESKTSMTVN